MEFFHRHPVLLVALIGIASFEFVSQIALRVWNELIRHRRTKLRREIRTFFLDMRPQSYPDDILRHLVGVFGGKAPTLDELTERLWEFEQKGELKVSNRRWSLK